MLVLQVVLRSESRFESGRPSLKTTGKTHTRQTAVYSAGLLQCSWALLRPAKTTRGPENGAVIVIVIVEVLWMLRDVIISKDYGF